MTENKPALQPLLILAWRIWSAGGDPVLIDDPAMHATLAHALRGGVVLEDEKGLHDPMDLKGMSHSVALPRSEISDPAGAGRERLLYRQAKKNSP